MLDEVCDLDEVCVLVRRGVRLEAVYRRSFVESTQAVLHMGCKTRCVARGMALFEPLLLRIYGHGRVRGSQQDG